MNNSGEKKAHVVIGMVRGRRGEMGKYKLKGGGGGGGGVKGKGKNQ